MGFGEGQIGATAEGRRGLRPRQRRLGKTEVEWTLEGGVFFFERRVDSGVKEEAGGKYRNGPRPIIFLLLGCWLHHTKRQAPLGQTNTRCWAERTQCARGGNRRSRGDLGAPHAN